MWGSIRWLLHNLIMRLVAGVLRFFRAVQATGAAHASLLSRCGRYTDPRKDETR
jgi:hypothetical protein